MSHTCILTPIIIGSWPMISAAVASAASSMGFVVVGSSAPTDFAPAPRRRAEVEVDHSEVTESDVRIDSSLTLRQGDLDVIVKQDDRGRLTVCVECNTRSKEELHRIGKEVAGRIVQQFAYHKLMTELRTRGFDVVDQSVTQDQSIKVRVRMNG